MDEVDENEYGLECELSCAQAQRDASNRKIEELTDEIQRLLFVQSELVQASRIAAISLDMVGLTPGNLLSAIALAEGLSPKPPRIEFDELRIKFEPAGSVGDVWAVGAYCLNGVEMARTIQRKMFSTRNGDTICFVGIEGSTPAGITQ